MRKQKEITESVRQAFEAANTAPFEPARVSGCGRAYVCVSSTDKAVLKAVAVTCKKMGLLFSRRGHYGTGGCSIYIGYDNADGRALGKSAVFADTLNAHGIQAYADAVGD